MDIEIPNSGMFKAGVWSDEKDHSFCEFHLCPTHWFQAMQKGSSLLFQLVVFESDSYSPKCAYCDKDHYSYKKGYAKLQRDNAIKAVEGELSKGEDDE